MPLQSEPVNTATGNFIYSATDLAPVGPAGLSFSRFYNSLDTKSGSLGQGWVHNFGRRLEFHSGRVAFVDSDGRRDVFKEQADGSYIAEDPWVHSTLAKEPDGSYRLTQKDKIVLSFCRCERRL